MTHKEFGKDTAKKKKESDWKLVNKLVFFPLEEEIWWFTIFMWYMYSEYVYGFCVVLEFLGKKIQ